MFCDLCDFCVHQSCYGEPLEGRPVPTGDWFCQRCEYLMEHDLGPKMIKCKFCPELKGIMKRVKKSFKNTFAHVSCVNWLPEIYFNQSKTEVRQLEKLDKVRKQLECVFCDIKYGYCLQCDRLNCTTSFHVPCAQRRGIIREDDSLLDLC